MSTKIAGKSEQSKDAPNAETIEATLRSVAEEDYGDSHKSNSMEIYKLFVEMADRISTRRQSANSFFLSVNTAIIAVVSYLALGNEGKQAGQFHWLVSAAGMAICYMWYRLIRSYKDLNTAKFKVVHAMEKGLPLAPYDAEWEAVGSGKRPHLYLPFTRVEMRVPWVFFVLHAVVFIRVIWALAEARLIAH